MQRRDRLARLHILLGERGIDRDQKIEMYAPYGVTTAADMSLPQLDDLIARLEGKTGGTPPVSAAVKTLRSEVLFLLTANPGAADPRKRGLGIPNDWAVLNPFIERHAGKRLPALTVDELKAFRAKLRAIRSSGWMWRPKERPTVVPVMRDTSAS